MQDLGSFITVARQALAALAAPSLQVDPSTGRLNDVSRRLASAELASVLTIGSLQTDIVTGIAECLTSFDYLPPEGMLPLPGGPVLRFEVVGKLRYGVKTQCKRYICFGTEVEPLRKLHETLRREGKAKVRLVVTRALPSHAARLWRRAFNGACPVVTSVVCHAGPVRAATA